MKSYPIGRRGESVYYEVITTCYGLVKLLMNDCNYDGEVNGEHFFNLDGYSVDVVEFVHKAQTFNDGETSISYTILDTDEQDWASVITIENGKIINVLEEAIEI